MSAPPPASLGQEDGQGDRKIHGSLSRDPEGPPQGHNCIRVLPAATDELLRGRQPSREQSLYWPRLASFNHRQADRLLDVFGPGQRPPQPPLHRPRRPPGDRVRCLLTVVQAHAAGQPRPQLEHHDQRAEMDERRIIRWPAMTGGCGADQLPAALPDRPEHQPTTTEHPQPFGEIAVGMPVRAGALTVVLEIATDTMAVNAGHGVQAVALRRAQTCARRAGLIGCPTHLYRYPSLGWGNATWDEWLSYE